MSPADEDTLREQLHKLELSFTKQLAELSGRIAAALTLRPTVDDHELRLRAVESEIPENAKARMRALEESRRVTWTQIITGCGVVIAAVGSAWWIPAMFHHHS